MKPTILTLLLAAGLSMPAIAHAQMATTAPATQATTSSSSTLNPRNLSSSQITQLQQTLKSQGYNVTADGVWGQNTVDALKKFQTAKGLPANGTLTNETVADLGIDLNAGSSTTGSATTNNSLNPAAGGPDTATAPSTPDSSSPSSSTDDHTTTGATPDTGAAPPAHTGTGSTSNTGSGY